MFEKIKLGLFLAVRFIARTNKWTTGFIIFVMTLTFINIVVINGILVGLIEGSVRGYRDILTGDVYISQKDVDQYIKNEGIILDSLDSSPYVQSYTRRVFVSIEALQEDERNRIIADDEENRVVTFKFNRD